MASEATAAEPSPAGAPPGRVGRFVEPVVTPVLAPWRAGGRAVDAVLDDLRDRTMWLWTWWAAQTTLRDRVPRYLAAILCIWYFVVFERLAWLRHDRFGTFDYDLGMYDQGIWQLAHLRGFMTVRGMHVFGHHANIGYLLLVPFYWAGIGGPQFLDVLNTLAVVAVALPVFGLATKHLKSSWAGFFLVVAYLFHFSPQWKIQETFHPESIAAPLVVGALYFASTGKWRNYALCVGAALLWKEDVALATAVLGLVVAVTFRQWRIGLVTIAGSAAWFLIATRLIMAKFAPDGAVFDSLFGPLGTSATDVVRTAAVHPSRLITTIRCHGFFDGKLHSLTTPTDGVVCPDPAAVALPNPPPRGLAALMGPYGYLSFLNPQLLAVGVPQHVVNSATTADFTWDLRWHYAMFPYLGALMGSVFTVVRRRRLLVAWVMIAVMVGGVVSTYQRGVGPWTTNHDSGWWPLTDQPVFADFRTAMAGVDDDARVSASYFLVPHLSHREYIYTFPNPWRGSNYGAGGTTVKLPDQNTITDVVVDRWALNPEDQAMFDAVLASGQFEVVYRRKRNVAGRISDVIHIHRIEDGPRVIQPVVVTPA
ncbi:MAG: DUF2079 domain-containing protein [Acidimicrobiales bacterium]